MEVTAEERRKSGTGSGGAVAIQPVDRDRERQLVRRYASGSAVERQSGGSGSGSRADAVRYGAAVRRAGVRSVVGEAAAVV